MANKHMERSLTSFIITELKIKTEIVYLLDWDFVKCIAYLEWAFCHMYSVHMHFYSFVISLCLVDLCLKKW